MKLGSKIRKLRELKGYSQEYMAASLDMSQNNYSKIELERNHLTLERLQQIARLLDIDPVKIIEFDDDTIFNNHNQQGGNAANYIFQHSEKMQAMLENVIQHLKEENAFLRSEVEFLRGAPKAGA